MKYGKLILAPALVLMLASCHRSHRSETGEGPMTVTVAPVVTDSVTLYKEYPGTLHANDMVEVVCRVNGTLLTVDYTKGTRVVKGQLLATVDPTTYRNAVAEAEATLETARSSNQYAEAHYAAVQAAAAHNAVSQMELAQALSQRDQSRAAINNARAALSQARTNLAKCTIKAPMTGHIGACIYSEGAYLAGEGEPVKMTEIYSDAIMEAYFYIEDASFLRMFENPDARSDIDYTRVPVAFSERLPHDYTADMTYISPAVDPSTGTMLVRANIDNRWGELRDGMYVTVSLPYRTDPQAMLVRDASISTDQRGKYLYTVTDSNTVVYTPIETGGLVNDTMRVVTSGVRPGQRYVTQALLKVRDGMPVKPVETR